MFLYAYLKLDPCVELNLLIGRVGVVGRVVGLICLLLLCLLSHVMISHQVS